MRPLPLATLLSLALLAGSTACSTATTPSLFNTSATNPTSDLTVAAPDPNQAQIALASDTRDPNAPWIGAAPANDALMTGAQDTFVAVWVDVPQTIAEKQAPAAVSIVIDTSGSMAEGNRIKHARDAAIKLVNNLRDGDMVSLHTFSDDVRERTSLTKLDAMSRQRIASIITELSAAGGTNLFEGVRQAGLAAMSSPGTHAVRRVVLLSDGNATVGTTSTEMIANLGEKAADRGVQITSIGVGLQYNENALNQLAVRSSGRLFHVTESSSLNEVVESELALLKSTRASGARVAIVPAPGVELVSVEGARFVRGEHGALEVPLGSMFAGQHREWIVRTRVNAPAEGSHALASVRLSFADPSDGNVPRIQETIARFEVTRDAAVFAAKKNLKAQGVMTMLAFSESTKAAAMDFERDDFAAADKRLAQAEEGLRMMAAQSTNEGERKRFEQSVKKVQSARGSGAAAAAAPAPAKAAAKRKSSLETNDAAMDLNGF